MERKEIFLEANTILETYCDGCFIKSSLRKDYGRTYAHQFCIKKCTVGEQLKALGKKLS